MITVFQILFEVNTSVICCCLLCNGIKPICQSQWAGSVFAGQRSTVLQPIWPQWAILQRMERSQGEPKVTATVI